MGQEGRIAGQAQVGANAMTRDEVLAFFERRQKLYVALDASALAADYAAEAAIQSPIGGSHVGPQAAERTLEAIFRALDLQTMVFEAPLIDGDKVAQVATFEGTHAGGEFLGLPPTGKRFHFTVAFLYDLQDGKIVRERRVYDFTGLLVQIGVLRAKPA